MMTQMAPMLEMMKAKMGKRRFGHDDADHGADDEPDDGRTAAAVLAECSAAAAIPGGFGGGAAYAPDGYGMGMGGGDFTGMLGGGGGGEMMSMIPQLMRMANFGGGHGHRRHRRR